MPGDGKRWGTQGGARRRCMAGVLPPNLGALIAGVYYEHSMPSQQPAPIAIVGLGNPGPRYELTRHNAGFLAVDLLADRWHLDRFRTWGQGARAQGELVQGEVHGTKVFLAKPATFMNRSGDFVQPLLHYYRLPPEQLLVIHDELDLPYGTLRLKSGGGAAGHKGLLSIANRLGTPAYHRLRVGIGRPAQGPTVDYVLAAFPGQAKPDLGSVLLGAAEAVESYLQVGIERAMNGVNR